MKVRAAVAVLLVMCVVACGEDAAPEPEPVREVREVPTSTAPIDPALCKQIEAMRQLNQRLYRDGHADDYSAEYDAQADAAGC